MKLKMVSILLVAIFSVTLLASCTQSSVKDYSSDLITTASVVDNANAFEKAIAKDGKWIIAITKDLKIDKELVLDGDFKNGRTDSSGTELIQRKIALYTQDSNKNVTNRFTLTAKKLTIKSANASIQHGTLKGDLYVAVNNFQLIDATIDGNIYFQSDEIKSTFVMDDKSKVTGVQEVKVS